MERLFNTYLFPELSNSYQVQEILPRVPVMNTEIRQEIYNVLLILCQNQQNCELMLELLVDVIPQGMMRLSSRVVMTSITVCVAHLSFSKIIRTNQTGSLIDTRQFDLQRAMPVLKTCQIHAT